MVYALQSSFLKTQGVSILVTVTADVFGDGRLVLGNVETDCDGKAVLACGIGE